MKDVITHRKDRIAIENDIIAGLPSREIAKKYGIKSHSTVQRYAAKKMPELISKAELKTVEGILDRISKYISTVEDLIISITEWLKDPNGELKIDASPRASEITTIYYIENEDTGELTYKKAKLQELIDEIYNKSSKKVDKLYLNIQDPRVTLLRAVDTLNKQLELLAKARGLVKEEVTVKVTTDLALSELVKVLKTALSSYPDALEEVINSLAEIVPEAI